MIQFSGENSKPLWSMRSGRVTIILPPSPPLSKDEGLRDFGHSMSTGNLIWRVNSVTISYLIHHNSLLQNATLLLQMRQLFYYKMRQKFITKCVRFLLQNTTVIRICDDFITKCDCYYKMGRLLQIATVH